VVERDGDLLGEGVNIAARLEGLAEIGGICVSRAVHEQVANKLSVQFADTIAEMEAKLAEHEGGELDHAIERLDHYKSIQNELSATAMH
jgi:hypothetical protein